MELTGELMMELNPAHIVSATDYSPETLRSTLAHPEASIYFELLVSREEDLDAFCSIPGFFLRHAPNSGERSRVKLIHECSHPAHDLVADQIGAHVLPSVKF